MLNVPTVFILGAGASEPFGFPTGWGLSKRCYTVLGKDNGGYRTLREQCGFPAEEIEDFRRSFFLSGRQSIDAFLECRDDLMRIGKAAIAQELIRFENEGKLFDYDDKNWLREMLVRLDTSSFAEFAENRLSFITYNYDRSVEHFLFTSLQNSYKKTDAECAAVLSKIPIIHLHGRLGFLPWQGQNARPYAVDINPEALKVSTDNIKVIHEDITEGRDDDFKQAKALLGDAEQIIFMGFGYNSKNIERLGIADLPGERSIIGTCQGLGYRGELAAKNATKNKVKLVNGDCIHFIREIVNWE
jgi:hypothetical protein